MKRIVGLDRELKLRWLDIGASLAESERDRFALRAKLMQVLAEEIPAHFVRYKTCTVLIRTWLNVPANQVNQRDHGFDLLKELPIEQRLVIHWGMLLLAYPFFRDATSAIGRAGSIQDTISRGQISRKIMETWGDRTTVKRSILRVFQTLADWSVLIPNGDETYHIATPRQIENSRLVLWFAKTIVLAHESPVPFSVLTQAPENFPFRLHLNTPDITRSGLFDTFREGSELLVDVSLH